MGRIFRKGKPENYERFLDDVSRTVNKELKDERQKWISPTSCEALLARHDVEAIVRALKKANKWKSDTSHLTEFVRKDATRLFMVLVLTRTTQFFEQFFIKGVGDASFPLEPTIEVTHASTRAHSRLLEFDSPVMSTEANSIFGLWQWKFFVPRLSWKAFDCSRIAPNSLLPFLGEGEEVSSTTFSTVHRYVIHRDYVHNQSNILVGDKVATRPRL
jgi:hypothetical protein